MLDGGEGRGGGIEGEGDAELFSQSTAVGVGVRDDDVARAGVTCDGGGHDADGSGAGDEDVFTQDVEGERGVYGVAEGVEDGGDFRRDAGGVVPDVRHGQHDEFRKRAVAINAYAQRVGAEVATAGEAVAAASADNVALTGNELAGLAIEDVRADVDDLADELVANGEADGDRLPGPCVPIENVEVCAADAGVEHADFDVVDAHFRLGNILEPEALGGL